jgi:hypothetical protein
MVEKKKTAKTPSATDLRKVRVTGYALANVLNVQESDVERVRKQGLFKRDRDGHYGLVDCVQAWCLRLKEGRKNAAPADKNGLDAQQAFWKTEKLKQQVRSWRVQRDRATALAVVEQIRSAMLQLRERLKDVRGIGRDFDELLAAVDNVDVEAACAVVEGEDEEEE